MPWPVVSLGSRARLLLASLGAVSVLALVLVWGHRRSVASAALAARVEALSDVQRVADSTASARLLQARSLWQAQQKTDTVWRTYVAKVSEAGAKIAAIPPAVRDSIPPVVEAALDACEALVADTAKLNRAILTERAEARELFRLDTLAIDGLKAQVVQRDDRIAQLERRPPWWKVVLGGVLVAGASFAAGAVK